ncbi:hypothetical protein GGR88_001842 [Sphingomonas jejuensis]|uniref:Uncharacterized protein n=1 Tax=Sphingomonas jejuensis TaxID=904715 RepID=A0ABX0XLV9_9SPHN|nr:hypothetical protein [Sphingomonas jejuensis]NJC34368.1 hypothetical protein [Sphingomonas jejuensis]
MIRTAAGPEFPALRLCYFCADPLRRIGGGRASQGPRGRYSARRADARLAQVVVKSATSFYEADGPLRGGLGRGNP